MSQASVTASSELSFFGRKDEVDLEVDLEIAITRVGNRHLLGVRAGGNEDSRFVDLSPDDVAAEIEQHFRPRMVALTGMDARDPKHCEDVRALAEYGQYLYRKIFGVRRERALIEEVLAGRQSPMIRIVSDGFVAPWELLVPADTLPDDIPTAFLGHRAKIFIDHINEVDASGGANTYLRGMTSEIVLSRPAGLSLCWDDRLPMAAAQERCELHALHDKGRIRLRELDVLDDGENCARELRNFFSPEDGRSSEFAHFACHAEWLTPTSDSYIRVRRGARLTHARLVRADFEFVGEPLVFLNACETGAVSPLSAFSFSHLMMSFGARGALATQCNVCDPSAARFASEVYDRFLGGADLGTSVLEARRSLLAETGDLTGFYYAMHARPDTRLRALHAE